MERSGGAALRRCQAYRVLIEVTAAAHIRKTLPPHRPGRKSARRAIASDVAALTPSRLFSRLKLNPSTQVVMIHCLVFLGMSLLDKGLHNPG
jgi:hypothetical protein